MEHTILVAASGERPREIGEIALQAPRILRRLRDGLRRGWRVILRESGDRGREDESERDELFYGLIGRAFKDGKIEDGRIGRRATRREKSDIE